MKNRLEIKVALQVLKPAREVFQSIIDPEHMINYFISESSGVMKEGETLTWKFSEFPIEFPIHVEKMEEDKYISYRWEVEGKMLLVEMALEPVEEGTVVTITEKSMPNDEKGLAWLMGNSAGWANFLACLKAYLEYGINLRKGAFDFMS